MIKMVGLLGVLIGLSLSSAQALPPQDSSDQLDCRAWGQIFIPAYLPTQHLIGRPGYGFLYPRDCYATILASHDGFICQFLGGQQFAIFDSASNRLIGVASNGMQSFADCRNLTTHTGSGQICLPRGTGAVSYNRRGQPSFFEQKAYPKLDDCFHSLEQASRIFLCHSNSRSQQVIGDLSTGEEVGEAFADLTSCQMATSHARGPRVCAPMADGFAIIETQENKHGQIFPSLKLCLQAIIGE